MPKWLMNGAVVSGHSTDYTIIDGPLIGGQAVGYQVQDGEGHLRFLKMFMEPTEASAEAADFVKRQTILMRRLRAIPDFVCRDVEFFADTGTFYKVSEWMHGKTLQQKLDEAEKVDWSQDDRHLNCTILASTIKVIHEHGIAHLDLKPDNCYLAERTIEVTGQKKLLIRLLDFDGALVEDAPAPPVLGTALYFSPEHTDPKRFGKVGKHSDIFALGIMLYEILARRYPFEQEHGFLERAATHPRDSAPWIQSSVADMMWQCLAPQPRERPTAAQVHQTLLDSAFETPFPSGENQAPIRIALVAHGRRIRFHKDGVLGRDIVRGIPGYEYMHKTQARLFRSNDTWVITQLSDPVNPTFLNSVQLREGQRHPLHDGDIIKVGGLSLHVAFEYE